MTVFLRYNPGGMVMVSVNNIDYVTTIRNNLSLVEVADEHVPNLMSKMCGCCGNERRCFSLAGEDEINRWKQE